MALPLFLAATILLLVTPSARAANLGFAGINDYTSGPSDCDHGDRAGASYVQNIDAQLSGTTVFSKTNRNVYDTDLKSTSTGPNYTNFFAYSGHGYNFNCGQLGGSSLHLYSRSSTQKYHGHAGEYYADVNTVWDELRLGHHGSTEELRWRST